MKIEFKKVAKYLCRGCGGQFNWSPGNSIRFGKAEYKTRTEKQKTDVFYCSKSCYNNTKKLFIENKK